MAEPLSDGSCPEECPQHSPCPWASPVVPRWGCCSGSARMARQGAGRAGTCAAETTRGRATGVGVGLGEVPSASAHRLSEDSTITDSRVPTEFFTGKLVLKRSTCITSSREDASIHGLSSKNFTVCKLITSSAHVSDGLLSTK